MIVPLSQGKVAIIDEDDWPLISGYRWSASKMHRPGAAKELWYARACTVIGGKPTTVLMHRLIAGAPDLEVDHKDGDGLNNRRCNLRLSTHSQNVANRHKYKLTLSRFKGVSKRWIGGNTWQARTTRRAGGVKKTIHIGSYRTEVDAARGYDQYVISVYGEFAVTNFPREDYF